MRAILVGHFSRVGGCSVIGWTRLLLKVVYFRFIFFFNATVCDGCFVSHLMNSWLWWLFCAATRWGIAPAAATATRCQVRLRRVERLLQTYCHRHHRINGSAKRRLANMAPSSEWTRPYWFLCYTAIDVHTHFRRYHSHRIVMFQSSTFACIRTVVKDGELPSPQGIIST